MRRSETATRVKRAASRFESFFAIRFKERLLLKGVEPRSAFGGKPAKARSRPNPTALFHLRALDWADGGRRPRHLKKASILAASRRPEPPDLVCIHTNDRVTLKTVEPTRVRGGMTWHSLRAIRSSLERKLPRIFECRAGGERTGHPARRARRRGEYCPRRLTYRGPANNPCYLDAPGPEYVLHTAQLAWGCPTRVRDRTRKKNLVEEPENV